LELNPLCIVVATQLLKDRWAKEQAYLIGRERANHAIYLFRWVCANGSRNGSSKYNPYSLSKDEREGRSRFHWDCAGEYIKVCCERDRVPLPELVCVGGEIRWEKIQEEWETLMQTIMDAQVLDVSEDAGAHTRECGLIRLQYLLFPVRRSSHRASGG
jgi:hypothetical protein